MEEKNFNIIFPDYYDDLYEFECEHKGYLQNVVVQFNEGYSYRLNFTDIYRLKQDFESEIELGNLYYFEPNLIVVNKVNKEHITKSIVQLVKENSFQFMKESI